MAYKTKSITDYITSIKFLNRWSVVYGFILLLSVIYNSIYTFQFYDFSDLFINYQGGFIRRGLFGEFLYFLHQHGINPIYTAFAISIGSYAIILSYMSHQFYKHGYSVGILLVSFLLGGIGVFGIAFFRRDFIVLCLFLLTMKLWQRLPLRQWIVCGNIVTIVALLCHEPYMFWAYPLLCLITHLRNKNWLATFAYWLPSLLTFLLCLHFSGNTEQYNIIRHSTETFLSFPNVMDFLSFDKEYVMRFHVYRNFIDSTYHIPNIIGSITSIIIAIYFCTMSTTVYNTSGISHKKEINYNALFLCVMVSQLPMFTILSTDYTRTIMYAALSSYIVLFTLNDEECSALFPQAIVRATQKTTDAIKSFIPPSRLKILFIMLCLSAVEWTGQGTFGILRNSELGNALMVVYKIATKICTNIVVML